MQIGNKMDEILTKTVNKFKGIFQDSLKSVILYGSYARGDFDDESDIDVIVLVDLDRPTIKQYFNDIVKFSSQIDLEYGIMLSPSIVPYGEFLNFQDDLPYYSNIAREGIVLNA